MGSDGDQCLPERMSGGAAVADVDGDGRLDVYLTNLDGPGRLYRNQGDGTFVDVTRTAGLDALPAGSNGAAFADVDNDGHPDLAVTMLGTDRTYFFHNRDGTHFDEDAAARGLAMADGRIHSGFTPTFGDVDGDGWLDLYVTEWASVEWTVGSTRSHQRLFRNLGAEGRPGAFEDVTDRRGVATEQPVVPVLGFGARLTDLDGDGRPDLVAGERLSHQSPLLERRRPVLGRDPGGGRRAPTRTAWASPSPTTTATAGPMCSSRRSPARGRRVRTAAPATADTASPATGCSATWGIAASPT